MKKHLAPRWTLQTTFYWEQTFRAGGETLIEHRYKPSVGASVQTSLGYPPRCRRTGFEDYKEKYCIDTGFPGRRRVGAQRGRQQRPARLQRAAHRLRPQDRRQLVGTDPGFPACHRQGRSRQPGELLRPGRQENRRAQFEMRKTDFTPEGNLAVLILKKMPPR